MHFFINNFLIMYNLLLVILCCHAIRFPCIEYDCWDNLLRHIYVIGSKCEEQPSPYGNVRPQSAVLKNEASSPHLHLAHNHVSKSSIADHSKVAVCYAQRSTPTAETKNFFSSNGVDSSGAARTCNGRPQGRDQLLPRYWPKITDKELQQISGEYPNFISLSTYVVVNYFVFHSLSSIIYIVFFC